MKIAIIHSIGLPIPAVYGGAIEQLVTALIEENEKYGIHQIYVTSPYKPGIEKTKKYLHTQIFYQGHIRDDVSLAKIKLEVGIEDDKLAEIFLWLEAIQPDVLVLEEGNYESWLPFTKYFSRKQTILHLHHDYYPCKSVEDSFGTVITVSEYAKKTYLSTVIEKETDVEIVRNCAISDSFTKRISSEEFISLRNKWGFTKEDFIVLYCGRIILEKGVLEVIKAVRNIKLSNIKLMVIGSVNFKTNEHSDYYERVLREIRESEGKIRYIGYVDNWELYKFYQIADIQVVPSLCEEVAGIVAIEGMMCGMPLITTDAGGLTEYVDKNCACIIKRDANMLENLKNSILNLYENPQKRDEMKTASFNRASLYSKEKYYQDFIKVCEQVRKKHVKESLK